MLPLDAESRIRKIKKAIRGDASYESYMEHIVMETYSMSYQELMNLPFEKYLEFSKIISLENKYEKKKSEEQKNRANS